MENQIYIPLLQLAAIQRSVEEKISNSCWINENVRQPNFLNKKTNLKIGKNI